MLLKPLMITLCVITVYFMLMQYNSANDTPFGNDATLETSRYIRHNLTNNIDCAAYFVNTNTKNMNRIWLNDSIEYKTDCASIKSRFAYPKKPNSKEEEEFPIAFVRDVYRDYVFLETIFRAQYEPQNIYAFIIDSKSDETFKKRIRNLASCFSNVVVPEQEFDIQSNGKNVTRAFLTGFEAMKNMNWRYVITLQNHDVVYKTNAELVRIFTTFGGANDISTDNRTGQIPRDVEFTFKNMHLFKNKTRNESTNPNQFSIVKTLVQVSISREAVDYIINVLNTSTLIENFEKVRYGMDENLFGTLNANEAIDLPGGFSTRCLDNGTSILSITRTSNWSRDPEKCKSKKLRHNICMYGTEDLYDLVGQPGIVANKFWPEFDFGAVDCLLERLHNRTYGLDLPPRERINLKFYEELPHVRYHKERMANGGTRPQQFKCT